MTNELYAEIVKAKIEEGFSEDPNHNIVYAELCTLNFVRTEFNPEYLKSKLSEYLDDVEIIENRLNHHSYLLTANKPTCSSS